MRFKKLGGIGAAAASLTLVAIGSSARATGWTDIADASGVDYDAACEKRMPNETGPPEGAAGTMPNSIDSPGVAGGSSEGGDGCAGDSTYDGNTESTDLTSVSLRSTTHPSTGELQLVASWAASHNIVTAGSTVQGAVELPDHDFTGTTYFALFQNKTKQTNIPTNPAGGCTHVATGKPMLDQHGSWKDGYHFFVAFAQNWDGNRWIQSAQIGEYDPSPDGGFVFTELGVNDGVDDDGDGHVWDETDVEMQYDRDWRVTVSGSSVTVNVDGVVRQANQLCGTIQQYPVDHLRHGVYRTAYASPGDVLANVKGLTTANKLKTLSDPIPLSMRCVEKTGDYLTDICLADLITIGGYTAFSDTTAGNSINAGVGLYVYPVWVDLRSYHVLGVAYTPGNFGRRDAGAVNRNVVGVRTSVDDSHQGLRGPLDTLGDGTTCPTPTFGGLLDPNPLFTPDTACQIDDENSLGRGSLLAEFWDTVYGFTA